MLNNKSTEDDLVKSGLLFKTSCPVCSSESKIIDKCKTINPNSNIETELRCCKKCKHWWNNPYPKQEILNKLYESGSEYVVPKTYKESISTSTSKNKEREEKLYNNFWNNIKKISKNTLRDGKFYYLEIGSGSGSLFNFFNKKAKVAFGVEPGEWRNTENKNIVKDISDLPNNIKYDFIVANDVLEHLENPIDMLSYLNKIANKNSIIHCTFPNKDSLKAQIQKTKWHMIRPFGHIHYFSKKSSYEVFNKSGWEIIKIKNTRMSDDTIIDLIKNFNPTEKKLIYRLFKSLIIGQIVLGKDQWSIVAINNK